MKEDLVVSSVSPVFLVCVCGRGVPAFWHLSHSPHLPPIKLISLSTRTLVLYQFIFARLFC